MTDIYFVDGHTVRGGTVVAVNDKGGGKVFTVRVSAGCYVNVWEEDVFPSYGAAAVSVALWVDKVTCS